MPISIFYGTDRAKISQAITALLGDEYELFDGETLTEQDLPSLFTGTNLFTGDNRKILIKDLSANPLVFEKLSTYTHTDFAVVVWEQKLDKRTVAYKALAKSGVKITEINLPPDPNLKLVFDVFSTAYRGDYLAAKQTLEKIQNTEEPHMFFGLLVSQALKRVEAGEKKGLRAAKILAESDIELKSTTLEPWTIIKKALLKISSL